MLLGVGASGAREVEVEHCLGHPQRFCRADHAPAAPPQRQAGDGAQTHADVHRPVCHR